MTATVTPLASIMGSGFLVSAPLLAGIVGNLAVVCMALLLVLAYMVGGAIRFNIRHFEPIENKGHGPAQDIAFLSRIVLVGAYFISVTYYLELLAAFLFNVILLLVSPLHLWAPLWLLVLLVNAYFLLMPVVTVFNSQRREDVMQLFNKASYYPLAIFVVVLAGLLF